MSRISNYPHLIGVSDDERKELHGVNEVANFICDQGRFYDLRIFTPDGEEVLNTFGIFIDRICDMEYREELMEVLVPKQKAFEEKMYNDSVADRRDEELNTLDRLFRAMKMDDMTVAFDEKGNLVCTDDINNKWVNAELYDFIINEALCFGADGKLVEGFEMDDELVEKIKAYAAEHAVYPDAVLQNPISANNDWDRVLNAFSVCPSLKSFVMNMVNEIENYLMKIFSEQKDGKYFIPYDAFEDSTGIVDNFDNKLFVDMLLDQDNIEDVEMDEKGYWVYVAPENCVTNTAVNDENVFTDETEEDLDAEL